MGRSRSCHINRSSVQQLHLPDDRNSLFIMASHQLAIAKASFSAGLLRPDPTSVSRDAIADFHTLLNTVVVQCSPRNVQKCKQWILKNIAKSAARFTALGKYLTALTASFSESGGAKDATKREPSIKRKRLHILYLVNDILFHTRHRVNDASICGKIQPILVSLVGNTASFKECPKHQRKVLDLLGIWEEKGYYSKDYIEKLRETVKNASEVGEHVEGSTGDTEQGLPAKSSKLTPYVMPAMHGDASTLWFDLPAGNLMPHIVPNSTRPINPDMIKPLQFVAGPAEEGLTLAVKALLDDVQAIFGDADLDEKATLDIDELGQPIVVDEITGDILGGEGYYGWSRTFCEKMKRRKKGLDISTRNEGRDERSRSRSSSPGIRKRRYSQSDSGSDRGADHFPSLLHHQSQGRQMEHHFKDLHRRHLPITSHPNRPCLLFHNLHSSKGSIPTFLHRLHHLHHQMCPSMVNLNTEHGLHHHRQCRT